MKITIITNNPMVREKYPKTAVYYDDGVEGVLVRVRDMVHCGAKVLSHPQSGSLAPGVSPYKSLMATCTEVHGATCTDSEVHGATRTDLDSLRLIEGALSALAASPATPAGPMDYDEGTLQDFQVLDLDLLDSARQSMAAVCDL